MGKISQFKILPQLFVFIGFFTQPAFAELSFNGSCGTETSEIFYQVRSPAYPTDRFALILNGSPATEYFSSTGGLQKNLVDSMVQEGFKVLEIKYPYKAKLCGSAGPVDGFYSLCCQQGVSAAIEHSQNLYDQAISVLGYSPSNPKHILVGLGFSLGAVQLQGMAYFGGRKFDKVALTGVLMGDTETGCRTVPHLDGMAWTGFTSLADSITTTGKGCSQKDGAPLEYTEEYNFDRLPYREQGLLGIFEGTSTLLLGHPAQADFIADHRNPSTTFKQTYKGCGHDIWICLKASQLNRDILDFFNQ